MKLSTRGQYGTRALLDLALHGGNGPVPLKDIAKRQDISLHYLEHLIGPLVAAGIIGSTRGARGGIQLKKHPREIKLSQVVPLLEGSLAPVECLNNPQSCPRYDRCVTREVWGRMKQALDEVLEATTLQGLVEKQLARDQLYNEMYYI